MATFSLDVDLVLGQFVKRFVAASKVEQVNNSRLYAGSPMTYYCKHCREHTETLPECHVSRPKTCCDPCKVLVDHGLIPDALKKGKAAVKLHAKDTLDQREVGP